MQHVCSFFPAFAFAAICAAQTHIFQGELSSETPRDLGQLTVELRPQGGLLATGERAFVSTDGQFQLRLPTGGSFLLLVTDRQGALIHQQYATAESFGTVAIRLPGGEAARPISGLISVDELHHKPGKAARKAFMESFKRRDKGDASGSLQMLERAVQLDPEYLQALNNLGSQYVRAGRYEDAVQYLRRAAALAPKTPLIHANLAQSLLFLRDYAGAEASAKIALALSNSDSVTPRARLALGLALAGGGNVSDARQVLATCTESPDEVVRSAAESFLKHLLP